MKPIYSETVFMIFVILLCKTLPVTNDAGAATTSLTNDPEVHAAFSLEGDEQNLQQKFTIMVNEKAEDCYYITNVKIKRTLNVHFVVSSFMS